MKSWNLNFLGPSGPLQVCNGTALALPYRIRSLSQTPHLGLLMKIIQRSGFLWLQLITIVFWNLHLNRNFRLSLWAWYVKGDRYFEVDGTFVTVRIHSASPYMPIFNENFLVLFVAIILLQPKMPYISSIVTEISTELRRYFHISAIMN
jgi:hypothetical protein